MHENTNISVKDLSICSLTMSPMKTPPFDSLIEMKKIFFFRKTHRTVKIGLTRIETFVEFLRFT